MYVRLQEFNPRNPLHSSLFFQVSKNWNTLKVENAQGCLFVVRSVSDEEKKVTLT
jgi:hypothetical protein